MENKRRVKIASSMAHTVSLIVSVIFFEYQASFLSQGKYIVLSAYISVALFAALCGYKFAYWYFPVENLRSRLEFFLMPIMVVFISSFCAGLCFGIATEISLVRQDSNLAENLQIGIFLGAMFIVGAWPALLLSNIAVYIFINQYQKNLQNR